MLELRTDADDSLTLRILNTTALRREVRQIIFEHFDQIVAAWREHFGEDRAE